MKSIKYSYTHSRKHQAIRKFVYLIFSTMTILRNLSFSQCAFQNRWGFSLLLQYPPCASCMKIARLGHTRWESMIPLWLICIICTEILSSGLILKPIYLTGLTLSQSTSWLPLEKRDIPWLILLSLEGKEYVLERPLSKLCQRLLDLVSLGPLILSLLKAMASQR